MLLAILTHSKGYQIVDLATVKPQDHVWINLFDFVLIMSYSVIEAAVGVYFTLNRDALFDLIEILSYYSHIFSGVCTSCSWPGLVPLLIGSRVELIKVESFNRLLKDLNYLLAGVLLIFRTAWSRLKIRIIDLLIDLTQVF